MGWQHEASSNVWNQRLDGAWPRATGGLGRSGPATGPRSEGLTSGH